MADKNVQSYLISVAGLFIFFIFALVGPFLFGNTPWVRIAILAGIGLVTLVLVSWLRHLSSRKR